MSDPSDASAPTVAELRSRKRRGWRFFTILAAILTVAAAGAISGSVLVAHYAGAAPLRCACGLGWAPPDNLNVRMSSAGVHQAMNVTADPTRRQAFYVEIYNPSSVTQTILGLTSGELTGLRTQLTVSAQDHAVSNLNEQQLTYAPVPARIPPHGDRVLRYEFTDTCHGPGTSTSWEGLDIRVRTGAFTDTESIDFGHTAMVVETKTSEPYR